MKKPIINDAEKRLFYALWCVAKLWLSDAFKLSVKLIPIGFGLSISAFLVCFMTGSIGACHAKPNEFDILLFPGFIGLYISDNFFASGGSGWLLWLLSSSYFYALILALIYGFFLVIAPSGKTTKK